MKTDIEMKVAIGRGLTLKNPVLVSSGTFGYGAEFADFMDLNRLGGIVTKAITATPRPGNPPPRTIETPSGLLNAIGLENVGIDAFVSDKLPFLAGLDTAVIVNVAGGSEDEYLEVVGRLDGKEAVDGFEINISCPNVKQGGIAFGTRPETAASLIGKLRRATGKAVIAKLSPNVTDIVEIAEAVREAGADALSLINTLRGMAIDVDSQQPVLANVVGGLSGPAIKPVALYNVYRVASWARGRAKQDPKEKIPIIGMGGIMSGRDAVEFLLAGADAVSVGTANFIYPDAAMRALDGIIEYCAARGARAVSEIVGRAIA